MQSRTIFPWTAAAGHGLSRPGSLPYFATAATIGIVTACQYLYLPTFAGYPFQLYFPVVAIAALVFGTGIFAALLSGLAALFFFIPPHFSLVITSPGPVVALVTFGIASLMIVLVVTLLRQIANHYFRAFERIETERSREAAVMLAMHHRAASSFHAIAATLAEQDRSAGEAAMRQSMQASARRFSALGRLHDRLALPRDSVVKVNARSFLERLCDDVQDALPGGSSPGMTPPRLEPMIQAGEITQRQATALGHLICEMAEEIGRRMTSPGGIITVNFSCEEDGSCVLLMMYGGATNAGSAAAIARRPVIATLVSQLRGNLEVAETASPAWLIRFPQEQPVTTG